MATKSNGSVRIEVLAREDCPNRDMALIVVERVVDVVHHVGLARKVARLKPLGVVKG